MAGISAAVRLKSIPRTLALPLARLTMADVGLRTRNLLPRAAAQERHAPRLLLITDGDVFSCVKSTPHSRHFIPSSKKGPAGCWSTPLTYETVMSRLVPRLQKYITTAPTASSRKRVAWVGAAGRSSPASYLRCHVTCPIYRPIRHVTR
jgi:hypothetical protein